jgi:hypothetical protein
MPPRFHDDCRVLSSDALLRCGYLTPGFNGTWEWGPIAGMPSGSVAIAAEGGQVTLRYCLVAGGEEICQRVPLDVMPCKPTRAERRLFRCPSCGRRCAKLFSAADRPFGCKECHGLGYRCQYEGRMKRVLRRASQIGRLLEGAPANGMVPPSNRLRHSERRMRMRARLQDALAILAVELLRDDEEPPKSSPAA